MRVPGLVLLASLSACSDEATFIGPGGDKTPAGLSIGNVGAQRLGGGIQINLRIANETAQARDIIVWTSQDTKDRCTYRMTLAANSAHPLELNCRSHIGDDFGLYADWAEDQPARSAIAEPVASE